MRAFLALLESRGPGELPARDVDGALARDGEATREALARERIVRDAAPAITWPCDGVGCARDVRELPAQRGARRFAGVCGRDPVACETVPLAEVDLARRAIALDPFVAALRRALRIDAPPRVGARAPADVPLLLGEVLEAGAPRDVFLALRPAARAFRAFLDVRAHAGRPTRVLVLTAHRLDPELAARHTGDARVAIDVLADHLVARDGRLAITTRLRVVRAEAPARSTTPPEDSPLAAIPRPSRWGEVTFFCVDGETVGVRIARSHARVTHVDLRLAGRTNRKPMKAFVLLVSICEQNGDFTLKQFGSTDNAKRVLSDLRAALRAAFALEDDPFERYDYGKKRWRPKFRALDAPPNDRS